MPFEKAVLVPLDAAATFALLTQPDRLRRWLTVAARIELQAGGDYRWTVTPGHSAAGTVVEVEPGKRLVYTWGWEDGGDPAPGRSTVTVTLTPVDGGTEVRLVHDGLTGEQAPATPRAGTTTSTGWCRGRARRRGSRRMGGVGRAARRIVLRRSHIGRARACPAWRG